MKDAAVWFLFWLFVVAILTILAISVTDSGSKLKSVAYEDDD